MAVQMLISPLPLARTFQKEVLELKEKYEWAYLYIQANYLSIRNITQLHQISDEYAFLYSQELILSFICNPVQSQGKLTICSIGWSSPGVEESFYKTIQNRIYNDHLFINNIVVEMVAADQIFAKRIGRTPVKYIFYIPNDQEFEIVPIIENPNIPEGKFFLKKFQ